ALGVGTSEHTTTLNVTPRCSSITDECVELVHRLRALRPGADLRMLVGGAPSAIVDIVEELYGFFPYAAGIVVLTTYLVLLLLFGLSMDYEVFLLARIKEAWDGGATNTAAVAEGLASSGRVITNAALIVVLVSLSFVSAEVILVKAVGLGTALAVLLDATVVRALLVPATMRLLGRWNWWSPKLSSLSLWERVRVRA